MGLPSSVRQQGAVQLRRHVPDAVHYPGTAEVAPRAQGRSSRGAAGRPVTPVSDAAYAAAGWLGLAGLVIAAVYIAWRAVRDYSGRK